MRLLLLALVVLAGPVSAQVADTDGPFTAAYLDDGLPPALGFLTEEGYLFHDGAFVNIRTATLVSDTLSVYFGLADRPGGPSDLLWSTVVVADTFSGAALGYDVQPRERGTRGAELEVWYEWGRRSLPVHVRLVPGTELVLWRSPGARAGAPLASREIVRAIQVGEPMPDLAVRVEGGPTVALDGFRGKTVVLNWWHTECGPCVVEIPGLNGLVERYGDRDDVVFFAVTDATPSEVAVFKERFPFAYRQTFVDTGVGEAVFQGGYPDHVVIAPDGTVAYHRIGGSEDAADDVEQALLRVLEP